MSEADKPRDIVDVALGLVAASLRNGKTPAHMEYEDFKTLVSALGAKAEWRGNGVLIHSEHGAGVIEPPGLPPRSDKSDNSVARARVRAQLLQESGDVLGEARDTLLKCMRGQIDPRTGEIQRKAALDVLSTSLDGWPTEALLAEVKRRAAAGQ